MTSPPRAGPSAPFVVATIPSENLVAGAAEVAAHSDVVDEITPCVYRIGRRGGISGVFAAHETHAVAAAMAALRGTGRPLLPSISDEDGAAAEVVAAMLRDPAASARHVWALADLVRRRDFRGIEVRYAALGDPGEDGALAFVTRLAASLHADGRLLAIALETDDAGTGQSVAAEIGAVVDEVRIATYEYHWAASPPGPLAPFDWLRQELARVTRTIAAEKVVVGVPAAGRHWGDDGGTPIGHGEASALAEEADGRGGRDPASGSCWFAYTDDAGIPHEVWFDDATSIAAKLAVAAGLGVHAVSLWLMADPDPALWRHLERPSPPAPR